MTKFQDKSFSVPLGGKAFRDGYDRAFKKKQKSHWAPSMLSQLKRESLEIKLEPKDIKKFVPLRDMIEEGTVKIKPIFKKQRKGREK